MFFSVIIPSFNRLPLLKEAVQSVLEQTFRDFEIIIIDDFSTDETQEYFSTVFHEKVKYFRNEKNKGVSFSRNFGAQMAQGKYLAFLDSDDLWEKQKLEKQFKFFEENPEKKLCHTNEKWFLNGTFKNQSKKHLKQGGFFYERAVKLCLVSPSSFVIEKSLFFEENQFDENLEVCEDYDLWLRLNRFHSFGFIDEALIKKRGGHEDQLSHKLPNMDKYRIISMLKIYYDKKTDDFHKNILKNEILLKLSVLKKGAEKHKNQEILDFCEKSLKEFKNL